MSRSLALAAALALVAAPALAQSPARIHEDLLVLDTHFDTPALFGIEGWDIMDAHTPEQDGSQVDYPRMVKGGVDGGFFVVFTPQGPRGVTGNAMARDAALVRITEIHEMLAANADRFELAITAADAERIRKAGKRFVYIAMENGSPVAGDLSLMNGFQRLGLTTIGLVHTRNNDLADSANQEPEWNGLSPEGRAFVARANRLGLLIDASHASDEGTRQTIELSRAPIILTHTGVDGVFDHVRNIPDELLKQLAAKGGVIQINAFSGYMIDPAQPNPERAAALQAVQRKYGRPQTLEALRAMTAERAAIEAKWPVPRADIDAVVAHIDHAVKVAGIDHVGLSGDFDGGGGVTGLEDVTDYPDLTARLLARGYTREDLAKFWGGNALRVLAQAQAAAEAPAAP